MQKTITTFPVDGVVAEQAIDFVFRVDVDATRRFLQQQQVWRAIQSLRYRDFLLIAARERADRLLRHAGVLTRKRRMACSASLAIGRLLSASQRIGDVRRAEPNQQIPTDREIRIETERARRGDIGAPLSMSEGARERDLARRGRQAGEGAQQFARAGALDAHQRDDFAGGWRKIDVCEAARGLSNANRKCLRRLRRAPN